MNEELQRQLVRQLKILNFWITFFGVTILLALAVSAFFVYKAVTYVHDASDKITSIQQNAKDDLNVRKQLCDGDNAVKNLLSNRTNVCKDN